MSNSIHLYNIFSISDTKISIIENFTIAPSFERLIERELYFKAVNRDTCEQILINRVDGSCLVRPYKKLVINFQINFQIHYYN